MLHVRFCHGDSGPLIIRIQLLGVCVRAYKAPWWDHGALR